MQYQQRKWLVWLLTLLITTCLCIILKIPQSQAISTAVTEQENSTVLFKVSQKSTRNSEQEGKALYQAGRFTEAAEVLEIGLQIYQTQGNILKQALILNNLSLVYQKLGWWSQAQDAITQSLQLLQDENSTSARTIFAHALNRQGSLKLSQGQPEIALDSWRQASQVYEGIEDEAGANGSLINQAQALQILGFHRRALQILTTVRNNLDTQPDSLTKVVGLRSLGNTWQLIGNLEQSRAILQESLTIAQKITSPENISAALISLGNVAQVQQDLEEALAYYQQAEITSQNRIIKVQAQLNQFSLLIKLSSHQPIQNLVTSIIVQLETLPPSRQVINARINLCQNLIEFNKLNSNYQDDFQQIKTYLSPAIDQAINLGDQRAEAYAMGTLGHLYEYNQHWLKAQQLTQKAIMISQAINAPDLNYLWQWQLGRILQQQGKEEQAITSYENSINILQSLRSDLVAIDSEVQFSFRQSVEPVYREFVSLLLKKKNSQNIAPSKLEKARKIIESLQVAELDNFFRSACLNANPVPIEQVDQDAAIIYPIILPDRLEIIVRIPQQPLRHYTVNLPQEELETTVEQFRRNLTNQLRQQFFPQAKKLYNWLIKPAQKDLVQSKVQTLVFVLDGVLRNIPLAALYDGKQYLIEQYGLAVTPGLELLQPLKLSSGGLQVLLAGISEEQQDFEPLPGVKLELEQIQALASGEVLLNEEFTKSKIQNVIDAKPFPVVHLATHGQFSSTAEDTFIQTWNERINVSELSQILRETQLNRENPIELLVLSACQTAKGDERAALGIAGFAVRSGALSTIASLWQVDDQGTADLMIYFYQQLAKSKVTKSEALRRAQITIMKDPQYRQHPYFWASFILVGNWF